MTSRWLTARSMQTAVFTIALAATTAHAAGFDLAEPTPPAVVSLAPQTLDWSQARLLPAALALAATEVRRGAAGGVSGMSDLRVDGDGNVDIALSTVIDLTLRHNLDVLVRSYDPILADEQLKAREAIFDPLLRFTMSLFSSTSPTSATLAGAAVLSRKQQQGNLEVLEQTPWGGQASLSFDNSRDTTNNSFSTLNPAYNSTFTLAYTQPLLRDFGKDITKRQIRIARNDRAASHEAFRDQVFTTVASAIDAYWDLVGRRENLAVQGAGLNLANDLLRINRTRVEVGTMAPLDVSAAEAEVARNQQVVIVGELDVKTAEDRLRQLMNVPASSPLWAATLRPVDPLELEQRTIDVEQAIQTALERRPELRRQSLAVDSARINLEYAKNQLKPGLSLQTSYGFNGLGGTSVKSTGIGEQTTVSTVSGGYGDAFSQVFGLDFATWRIAAVLEIPVLNQLARANHAGSLLQVRQGEGILEVARQAVSVEVRRLARAVETNRKSTEAAGVTRSLQEKRLDAERKKFEHGLSTNFEVQQAQKDLTDARTSEVLSKAGYKRSVAAFERAVGTLLETYDVHIQD